MPFPLSIPFSIAYTIDHMSQSYILGVWAIMVKDQIKNFYHMMWYDKILTKRVKISSNSEEISSYYQWWKLDDI